jgi:hypothetical protein
MAKFVDLRKSHWDEPCTDLAELRRRTDFANKFAEDMFPVIMSKSALRLWRIGEPIANRGHRLLIGIADWSLYDLALLDTLNEHVRKTPDAPRVDVFNLSCCRSQEDFLRFFPQIENVVLAPVVGLWQEGIFVSAAIGWKGIKLLEQTLDLRLTRVDRAKP